MTTRRRFLTTSASGAGAAALSTFPAVAATAEADDREPLFSVGLIADAQYADVAPGGIRHYRESVGKLRSAVKAINEAGVEFSIHLGDLIDRDFASFDAILEPLEALERPIHQILGNHDYSVDDDRKPEVPARMGISAPYHAFSRAGFRFVFLDGTEVSTFAHPRGSAAHETAAGILAGLKAGGRKNAQPWNGGIGPVQLAWLETQLAGASEAGEKAILSCHYPILPDNGHNLWNDAEVLALIDRHPGTVAAWFNGHNHAGNYAERHGVHYVTVHGMVDTPDTNAYAVLEVLPDVLRLRGTGREPDRLLGLK